jgi:hypothetical protein
MRVARFLIRDFAALEDVHIQQCLGNHSHFRTLNSSSRFWVLDLVDRGHENAFPTLVDHRGDGGVGLDSVINC